MQTIIEGKIDSYSSMIWSLSLSESGIFGLVWFDLVWFGLVGLVWFGLVWYISRPKMILKHWHVFFLTDSFKEKICRLRNVNKLKNGSYKPRHVHIKHNELAHDNLMSLCTHVHLEYTTTFFPLNVWNGLWLSYYMFSASMDLRIFLILNIDVLTNPSFTP